MRFTETTVPMSEFWPDIAIYKTSHDGAENCVLGVATKGLGRGGGERVKNGKESDRFRLAYQN
jgi:hypothetical protein